MLNTSFLNLKVKFLLTSIMSAEFSSPECLSRTLFLLSSMDMVSDTMINWSPRIFL